MATGWSQAQVDWLATNNPAKLAQGYVGSGANAGAGTIQAGTGSGLVPLSYWQAQKAAQTPSGSSYSSNSSYSNAINYTAPSADSIYKAPSHPGDYGLTGQVDPIDTSGYLLGNPADVDYRYNPNDGSPYMDMYQDWADTGFISRDVQPEDTVAWQMNQLLDRQSPYISQARQQGEEFAASRGLLNSSMGATASQRAAIEGALPIAQQDASTYFSQGINNQNLANQFALARQNAGMQGIMEMDRLQQTLNAEFERLNSQIDMFNTELDMKAESFNSTMQYEAAMAAQALGQQQKLARAGLWMDGDALAANVALTLEGLEANVAVAGAQLSQQASQFAESMAYNISANYQNGLLSIWQNTTITAEQSAAAEDRWNQLYKYTPIASTNYAAAYA